MLYSTLIIMKPDAYKFKKDIINNYFSSDGFRIINIVDNYTMSDHDAKLFYNVHKGKPYFEKLIKFMTSGPIAAYLISSKNSNVIESVRKIIGPTDSEEARKNNPKSVRAKYGTDKTYNAMHSSDSSSSFESEIFTLLYCLIKTIKKNYIITMDGTAGSGKSTLANNVSKLLNIRHLNSGEIYRLLSYILINTNNKFKNSINNNENIFKDSSLPNDLEKIVIDTILSLDENIIGFDNDGITYKGKGNLELRTPEINKIVPYISQIKEIRVFVRKIQRSFADHYKQIIGDGRDLGTVVFPNADVKFYIDADIKARAQRRNENPKDLLRRDQLDSQRHESPLKPAEDAIVIDNTDIEQTNTTIYCLIFIWKKLSQNEIIMKNISEVSNDETSSDKRKCIIISGAAHSGKTTLINRLKEKGYYVVPESAEEIIRLFKSHNTPLPWNIKPEDFDDSDKYMETLTKTWVTFQMLILISQYNNIKKIPKHEKIIIMDRGAEDAWGYYKINVNNISKMPGWIPTYKALDIPLNDIRVFYLKPILKSIEDNGIRFEDSKEQIMTEYNVIYDIYFKNRYYIVRENKLLSIEDRINVVEKLLESI